MRCDAQALSACWRTRGDSAKYALDRRNFSLCQGSPHPNPLCHRALRRLGGQRWRETWLCRDAMEPGTSGLDPEGWAGPGHPIITRKRHPGGGNSKTKTWSGDFGSAVERCGVERSKALSSHVGPSDSQAACLAPNGLPSPSGSSSQATTVPELSRSGRPRAEGRSRREGRPPWEGDPGPLTGTRDCRPFRLRGQAHTSLLRMPPCCWRWCRAGKGEEGARAGRGHDVAASKARIFRRTWPLILRLP